MGQDITPEAHKVLEEMLNKARPYEPDDPEYNMFDGKVDQDRADATMAQKMLGKSK